MHPNRAFSATASASDFFDSRVPFSMSRKGGASARRKAVAKRLPLAAHRREAFDLRTTKRTARDAEAALLRRSKGFDIFAFSSAFQGVGASAPTLRLISQGL